MPRTAKPTLEGALDDRAEMKKLLEQSVKDVARAVSQGEQQIEALAEARSTALSDTAKKLLQDVTAKITDLVEEPVAKAVQRVEATLDREIKNAAAGAVKGHVEGDWVEVAWNPVTRLKTLVFQLHYNKGCLVRVDRVEKNGTVHPNQVAHAESCKLADFGYVKPKPTE